MRDELKLLWKKRMTLFWKEAIRYLRVIVTGYMYVPIILLISLAYLYHYILTNWTGVPWVGWIFALVLSVPITASRVRTFLLVPDCIYLLSLEEEMRRSYFRWSLFYSVGITLISLFLIMLLFSPLYYGMISENKAGFYGIYLVIAGLATVNLYMSFQEQRVRHRGKRVAHKSIRWFITFLFVAGLFQGYFPLYAGCFLCVGLGTIYYVRLSYQRDLFWTDLIEIEQRQLLRFYRFAGIFMDVPQLPVEIKKRKWIIYGMKRISFNRTSAYSFLFLRSLVRYQDIFSLYCRLLLIAGILLCLVSHLEASIGLFFLFLYLNGVQLTGSWQRVKSYFWDSVYPLTSSEKVTGFSAAIFTFLLFQSGVGTVILGFRQGWGIALCAGIIGIMGSYLYAYPIMQKKLKEREA